MEEIVKTHISAINEDIQPFVETLASVRPHRQELFRIAQQAGICPWCVLRFASVGYIAVYRDTHLFTVVEQLAGAPCADPATCPACGGLFAYMSTPAFIAQAAAAIAAFDCDASRFWANISLPPGVELRSAAAAAALAAAAGLPAADLDTSTVPVKLAIKWAIGGLLSAAVGLPVGMPAPLRLHVALTCPALTLPRAVASTYGRTCRRQFARHGCHGSDAEKRGWVQAVQAMSHEEQTSVARRAGQALVQAPTEFVAKLDQVPDPTDASCIDLPAFNLALTDISALTRALPPTPAWTAVCEVSRDPIYVAGYYRKVVRMVSQTPWGSDSTLRSNHYDPAGAPAEDVFTFPAPAPAPGAPAATLSVRMHRESAPDQMSVAECIAPVLLTAAGAQSCLFHAAGREDRDVRMLGGGRPFFIGLTQPRFARRIAACAENDGLTKAVNEYIKECYGGTVETIGLRVVSGAVFEAIRDGEGTKRKHYAAGCTVRAAGATPATLAQAIASALTRDSDLELQQRTPIRVMHRRALMTRPKMLHALSVEGLTVTETENGATASFTLKLTTAAGLYVKEFCHGDLGRTVPNMGGLVAEVLGDVRPGDVVGDIDWLDVERVEMDLETILEGAVPEF